MNAYGIILSLAAAIVAGIVGSFALMKRMTLAGDVVSHLALPGLGLALLWHIQPLIGAAVTLALGVIIIDQLQRRGGLATETAIGVVFVAGLSIGTLLTPREDLIDALFGGFPAIGPPGFIAGMIVCAVIAVSMFLLRDRLILIIFSPDLAHSAGVNVRRVNFLYLCVFGLAILVGLQYLGALLVGSMIIVPAAIGRRMAKTLTQFLIISPLAGMLSVAIGLGIASRWQLVPGPVIAAVAAALFFALVPLRRRLTS